MRISKVSYSMLRKTGSFENDRGEVEVELMPSDDPVVAYAYAKEQCELLMHAKTVAERNREALIEEVESLGGKVQWPR